jgi:peptidoglycan hydrolase-like protein with peptidoglycan-binding domain
VEYPYRRRPRPGGGGDCTGLQNLIYAVAHGKPLAWRFSTGTWKAHFTELGFAGGLGTTLPLRPGVLDRPYPGTPVGLNSPKKDHVKWIQARLNFAAGNKHPVLHGQPLEVDDGYGENTEKVVKVFQRARGLQGLGMCGPKTWPLLNAIR